MTAEEAIEVLKNNYPKTAKMVDGRYKGGFDDFECEVGQAFGTAIEALEEVEQYRALGTVEELKEAKEKQIPKKPKNIKDYLFPETYDYDYSTADCPCCGESFSFDESYQINFCNGCGQAIDWSEGE